MSDFDLHAPEGANKKKRIVGRGSSSGRGTTAGRGNKGQQSRSGGKVYVGFEGGQMPMMRRIPKRGFNNARFAKVYQIVNVEDIASRFEAGTTVGFEELHAVRLVQKDRLPIKILANGEIDKALTIRANAFSAGAKAKIEAAGGKVEVV